MRLWLSSSPYPADSSVLFAGGAEPLCWGPSLFMARRFGVPLVGVSSCLIIYLQAGYPTVDGIGHLPYRLAVDFLHIPPVVLLATGIESRGLFERTCELDVADNSDSSEGIECLGRIGKVL
jgi:hypothetical protein